MNLSTNSAEEPNYTLEYYEKLWEDIWKKIYNQKGNNPIINCSFELYQEILETLRSIEQKFPDSSGIGWTKTPNWFEYSKEILEWIDSKNSNLKYKIFRTMGKNLCVLWNLKYKEYRSDKENEDELTRKQIEAEILGIICHRYQKTGEYTLVSIKHWNEEICDTINKSDFEVQYKLSDSDLSCLSELDNKEIKSKFDCLDEIKGKNNCNVEKIYIYPELKSNYVRFNKTVILKDDNENYVNECLNSIVNGLQLLENYNTIKKSLFDNDNAIKNYEDCKESLKNITDICALSAKLSVNKTTPIENNIWLELLQNVNDHIIDSNELKITIKEKTLRLEYPDKGFTIRDFIAISTVGNSTNVLINDQDREGRKGSGFKSVYNLFGEVVIESGPVMCTLTDQPVDIVVDNDKVEIKRKNSNEQKNWNYPIPDFKKYDNKNEKLTVISLKIKDNIDSFEIYKMIFGESYSGNSNYIELFQEKKDYLFLKNIKVFRFDIENQTGEFNKEEYINKHYINKEASIEIDDDLLDLNPYWKEKKGNTSFENKKEIRLLFPITKDECDECNDELKSEKNVYCTLPVQDAKLKIPFYINIPLLELKNDRKSLSECIDQSSNMKEWNEEIIKLVFRNAIKKVFEDSTSSKDEINLNNLYKYFPYECNNFWGINLSEYTKEYPYIRTVCVNNQLTIIPKSISEMVTEKDIDNAKSENFIFLPDYMYWWFSEENNELSEFQSDIHFVYYESKEVSFYDESLENIASYLQNKKDNLIINFRRFKRTEDGCVGKILLTIRDYLYSITNTKNEKENKKNFKLEDLVKLLKKVNDCSSASNTVTFNSIKSILYHCLINLYKPDDEPKSYHCIGNGNLDGKSLEIANYESIDDWTDKSKDFFGKEKFDPLQFKLEFCEALNNNDRLIENPYLKYARNWQNKKIYEEPSLRDVPVLTEEIYNVSHDCICQYTYDLFRKWSEFSETDKDKIRKWIQEKGLWLKINNSPYKISSETYYSSKRINYKNIISIHDEISGIKECIKNLDDEIKNEDFYKNSSQELISQVLDEYGITDGFSNYIISKNNLLKDNEKFIFLINKYIEKTNGIKWMNHYKDILIYLSDNMPGKSTEPVFILDSECNIANVSKGIKDRFEIVVPDKIKNNTTNYGNLTLQQFIEERVFVLNCPTGKKLLYCWAKKNEESVIILFNGNAFGKMLREVFDCNDYSENKTYEDMTATFPDILNSSSNTIELSEEQKETVKININRIRKNKLDKEQFINHTINPFGFKYKEHWIHAEGYGDSDYCKKKCPICNSILIAEKSILKLNHILYTINDSNYHLPMVMCENCYNSFRFTDEVKLDTGSKTLEATLRLDTLTKIKLPIIFSMHAAETKTIGADISFFLRWIWYLEITNPNPEFPSDIP